MKAIAVEIRHLVIIHYKKHHNPNLTCQTFQISRSSLWRFLKLNKSSSSLHPKKKTQPRKFSQEHSDYILHLIKQKAKFYTVGVVICKFKHKYKLKISATTVRRILRNAKLKYKKVQLKAKIACKKKTFYKTVKNIPVSRLLSIDEMGFGHGFIQPKNAWWYQGQPNTIKTKRTRFISQQKTVLCVTSAKDVINYTWFKHATNTQTFVDFLRLSLIGYSGYFLILDNVSFHKSKRVKHVLKDLGITPVFIDPYSPEQNPIEEVFSAIKNKLRSYSPNTDKGFERSLRRSVISLSKKSFRKYFMRSLKKMI